jgi:hypothetical protein
MNATRAVLGRIHDEQRTSGEQVRPPATAEELAAVTAFVQRYAGTAVPAGYLAFLRSANGVDFNGTTIYATRQHQRADGTWQLGFPEQNLSFGDGVGPTSWLLLGETGDDYFAVDVRTGRGAVRDKVSLQAFEEFDDVEGLLHHVLRAAYGPA